MPCSCEQGSSIKEAHRLGHLADTSSLLYHYQHSKLPLLITVPSYQAYFPSIHALHVVALVLAPSVKHPVGIRMGQVMYDVASGSPDNCK